MNDIKYAVEQRLRFIDFLIAHYGTLRREALIDYFGISMPQASNDIGRYVELAPSNLVYDMHAKWYRRGNDFKRVWS